MAALNKYESSAKAFLAAYPYGSIVRPEQIVDWATEHADGLKTDLLLDDPDKRLNALRRHLNAGGASRNLTEDERFYIAIEDTKHKTMLVKSLAEHVNDQAEMAFDKSISGAIAPIKRSQKAIDDIRLEQVENETLRENLETQLRELVETAEPLRNLLSKQNIDRHAKRLEAKGYSSQQARDLLELMPTFSRFAKTQRLLG